MKGTLTFYSPLSGDPIPVPVSLADATNPDTRTVSEEGKRHVAEHVAMKLAREIYDLLNEDCDCCDGPLVKAEGSSRYFPSLVESEEAE